jgi:hypothetical protein
MVLTGSYVDMSGGHFSYAEWRIFAVNFVQLWICKLVYGARFGPAKELLDGLEGYAASALETFRRFLEGVPLS